MQGGVGEHAFAHAFVPGGVALHFAVHFQLRRARTDDLVSPAHLRGAGVVVAAVVGVRQQRDLGFDAEQFQAIRRLQRGFGDLFGGRVHLNVGVEEEPHALVVDDAGHRGGAGDAFVEVEHAQQIAKFLVEPADQAADHRIRFTAFDHQRSNQRRPRAQQVLGRCRGYAAALGQRVVLLPIVVEAGVVVDVGEIEIDVDLHPQAEALDAGLDHIRTADQDRARQLFVDHRLHGEQYGFLFAFGVHDPFPVAARAVVHRLHQQAGAIDELAQFLAVGGEIHHRPRGDAGIHRGLRHCRRQHREQARVERTRDDVVGAEARDFAGVGAAEIGRLHARELGDGAHAGELHRFVDFGRAHVQRAAEDVREAQRVVDLVRIVRTAGGDDAVGAHAPGVFRVDLGVGVGQRQDDRLVGHRRDHVRFEDAGGGQTQEHVGADDDLGQRALVGVAGVAGLVGVEVRPAGIDHAVAVHREDVLRLHAQGHQHVQAGDARGAGAGGGQRHVFDFLADDLQRVKHGGADDDGSAVLVVVEDRNVHALAQLALDDEALRRLDIFEIDAAEGRFQRGDDVDQLVGVALVDFDIEHVDAGELLEQHALALHHRLAGERPDVAQTQHRGAVGDHRDQVAARGHFAGGVGVGDDGFAGEGHARRVGEGQIALGHQRLGRHDLDLARRILAVVGEGGLLQVVVVGHGVRAGPVHGSGPSILAATRVIRRAVANGARYRGNRPVVGGASAPIFLRGRLHRGPQPMEMNRKAMALFPTVVNTTTISTLIGLCEGWPDGGDVTARPLTPTPDRPYPRGPV